MKARLRGRKLLWRRELQRTDGRTATTIQEESAARARAERSLADEIRRRAEGRTPDDATLLYLAQWVERRGSDQDTALVAAGLLGANGRSP